LFSVDDGVPAREERIAVSFTERNFYFFFLSGKIFGWKSAKNKAPLSAFCLVFCPLLSKKFWERESARSFGRISSNRKKKKIGHRREEIGCEINRAHLAETANDCADKANIVCGIECNI